MTIPSRVRLTSLLLTLLFSFSVAQQPPQSAAPALPADIPATAERYSMLLMGTLAGQQAVWTASDGTLHIFFQFNDRGRGPKTTSVLKLGANGIPVSESVTGNDYLKSPVDENYSLESGTARWKNTAEQGEKKIAAPAFYLALNGGPSEIALLAHAALQDGGKIALLPEGEARVQRKTELDVEASGHKKHVTLYAIAGLDFSPTYFWAEAADKANDKFFGTADEWGSIIPEGWEASNPRSASRPKQDQRFPLRRPRRQTCAPRAQRNSVRERKSIRRRDGKIIRNQDVFVYRARITTVGPSEAGSPRVDPQLDVPLVIDATGKTLLPGLWICTPT